MKNIVLITILLLASCQLSTTFASEPEKKHDESLISICSNDKSFLPVFGASLGQTTEDELAELGSLDEQYSMYHIHGQKFWVHDEVFDHMHVSRPMEVAKHWRNMGFSWYLTYEQIYQLFECLGFNIDITKEPHFVDYDGYDSFTAKLTATKKSENLKVVLNFRFNKEKNRNSEGTLYNMTFRRINKT